MTNIMTPEGHNKHARLTTTIAHPRTQTNFQAEKRRKSCGKYHTYLKDKVQQIITISVKQFYSNFLGKLFIFSKIGLKVISDN